MMAVWSEINIGNLGPHCRIDPEYYQPFFLHMIDTMRRRGAVQLSPSCARIRKTKFTPRKGASFNYIEISKVSTTLGNYDTIEIPDEIAPSRAQYVVKTGDVIVSEVRPNRSAIALIPHGIGRTICSSGFAVIEPVSVSSEFLFSYLKTDFVTHLLTRDTTATMYPAVSDEDIIRLPFIRPSQILEETVTQKVREAFSNLAHSRSMYAEAKELFLSELGLVDLHFSPTLFCERLLSETQQAGRLDAEFYQFKYQRILDVINSTKPKHIMPLGEFLAFLTNGHTPLHHDLSKGQVSFLTAEHVFDFRVDYESEKRILQQHNDGELKRTRLKKGDCLMTIKGRIGNVAIAENFVGSFNINQDVALFRLKENTIMPYYLMAYLNSEAGKAFTLQYCTGQINPFLGLGNIQLLPVPVYDDHLMMLIATKTEEAVLKAKSAHD